ncbi:hypothetical protein MASSI9I_60324 [Massilia sp. 9I]|nr:hypothetical protein MASSI9I_60324 [Massilia sp. 9I]
MQLNSALCNIPSMAAKTEQIQMAATSASNKCI